MEKEDKNLWDEKDERADRIALRAAEDLVRTLGFRVDKNLYGIPKSKVDDYVLDCLNHLDFHGKAFFGETEDGEWVAVNFDMTLI